MYTLLCLACALPLLAQQAETHDRQEVNSIVLTFDPPIIAGKNCAPDLFNAILATMNNGNPSPATEVSREGAIWSASQNLSGVQFSLLFPDKPLQAVAITVKLIANLSSHFKPATTEDHKADFANYLHQICEIGCHSSYDRAKVSLYISGAVEASYEELQTRLKELDTLYEQSKIHLSCEKPVLPDTSPTIFEVVHWGQINAKTFFSAKFIGEQFKKDLSDSNAGYEIIFAEKSIRLVLFLSGTENELFKSRPAIEQFSAKLKAAPEIKVWHNFSETARALLNDDLRDLGKASMFNAWIQHWQGDFGSATVGLDFVVPEKQCSNVSMPDAWSHQFSISSEIFPSFIACSDSQDKQMADIAIAINASNTFMIQEIIESLKKRNSTNFPFSVATHGSSTLLISLNSHIGAIGGNLARLRARILNTLVEKNLRLDLPNSLKIGIAAVSNQPPFVLRGLLMDGWSSLPQKHTWSDAKIEDIADLLQFPPGDREALLRRWQLLTTTAKGKAELLALMSLKNLKLVSFSQF